LLIAQAPWLKIPSKRYATNKQTCPETLPLAQRVMTWRLRPKLETHLLNNLRLQRIFKRPSRLLTVDKFRRRRQLFSLCSNYPGVFYAN